jgi:hypothetical protein
MKTYQRITLMAVTTAYAGYLIRQAVGARAERLCRLAAGESVYERSHPGLRQKKRSCHAGASNLA